MSTRIGFYLRSLPTQPYPMDKVRSCGGSNPINYQETWLCKVIIVSKLIGHKCVEVRICGQGKCWIKIVLIIFFVISGSFCIVQHLVRRSTFIVHLISGRLLFIFILPAQFIGPMPGGGILLVLYNVHISIAISITIVTCAHIYILCKYVV